ncbi:pyruvate kinase [Ureaplasma diversum]|uniref:pyruvate kinase n=1 Tax=Ureaplasma diversum TaxID=42094 RepID=UPI000A52A3BB|nr:pyruvate kinase [Ureaplasma diversum]
MTTIFSKTRIIATVGPAIMKEFHSWEEFKSEENKKAADEVADTIKNLIYSGVNIFRINLSHNSASSNIFWVELIRQVAKEVATKVDILFDTKGPEIRISELEKPMLIQKDSEIKIYCTRTIIGANNEFSVSDASGEYNMAFDTKEDDRIFIDDGKLVLKVKESNQNAGVIYAIAQNSHTITTNKRINLPDCKSYSIPFLSKKDEEDIKLALKMKIPYIALSFLSNIKQLNEVKKLIKQISPKSNTLLIPKIETQEAINNIQEIVDKSDGVMIARGDLGLEVDYAKIPKYQELIINTCNDKQKYVIVATQMLDSLERSLMPTRAEVSDVYYATRSKVSSLMLSGETAAGVNPVNAVQVMKKIILEVEATNYELNFLQKDLNLLEQGREQKKAILELSSTKTTKHKVLIINTINPDPKTLIEISKIDIGLTIIFVIPKESTVPLLQRGCNVVYREHPIKTKEEVAQLLFKKVDEIEPIVIYL